jgi:hypothetical protein
MPTYPLSAEPRDRELEGLFGEALLCCDTATVVISPDGPMSQTGLKFLDQLQPLVVDKRMVSEWPGSQLADPWAEQLIRFRFDEEAIALICATVPGLYQFQRSWMPDDLAIYRHDGRVWLGSTAHENYGWLELSEEEHRTHINENAFMASLLGESDN